MRAARSTRAPTVEVLRDPDRAAALLDPQRRRLVEALREGPDSASGLARRLGESRQRLNYHLRALEDAGLVQLQEERRRGNCVERVLRVVARGFVVDPAALGDLAADPDEVADRFSATYLIALAARTIRELAGLRDKAARERKRLSTAAIEVEVRLAHPADFHAFLEDLSRAVARAVAKHHDERARSRPFRVIAGAYPAPQAGVRERRDHGEDR
ncbi:MAG: ArsR/SmtB family transcription factor [Gemmatimonadota bacterium]